MHLELRQRFYSVLYILFLFVVSIILTGCKKEQPECVQNYVQNGDFESGSYSYPYVVPTGDVFSGGWYSADGSVDLNKKNAVGQANSENEAYSGDIWLTLFSDPANNDNVEAVGVPTKFRLYAGETYKIRFYGAAGYGKNDKGKLNIYLSSISGQMEGPNRGVYALAASVEVKGDKWKKYEIEFTPNINATQIMLVNEGDNGSAMNIDLDAFNLFKDKDACLNSACTGTVVNLVRHPSFEGPGIRGGWGNIQVNFDNRLVNRDNKSNWREETYTPIKNESGYMGGNYNWIALHSVKRNGLLPPDYKNNGAVAGNLKAPLIPGQKYRISFLGATKDPWFNSKAKINLGLSVNSFCPGIGGTDYSGCNQVGDYNVDIPFDLTIHDEFQLHGDTKQWNYYYKDVTVEKPHEYILIQAQGGSEPAIDGVCITSEPFSDPTLFYNTVNSVRKVDQHKMDVLIAYNSGFNLFGLSKTGNDLMPIDNAQGILTLNPLKTRLETTGINLAGQSLATDFEHTGTGSGYLAADYKVFEVSDLYGSAILVQKPASFTPVQAPLSLARSGDYLFVAGENEISITNIITEVSALIIGHGISMAGFMDVSGNGTLYISDPSTDSVKFLYTSQIATLKSQLDNSITPNVGNFTVLSQDPLLSDMVSGPEKLIRGPIGVDAAQGKVWVSVDTGTGNPGKIVTIEPFTGDTELYLDNLQGPRDLVVVE